MGDDCDDCNDCHDCQIRLNRQQTRFDRLLDHTEDLIKVLDDTIDRRNLPLAARFEIEELERLLSLSPAY